MLLEIFGEGLVLGYHSWAKKPSLSIKMRDMFSNHIWLSCSPKKSSCSFSPKTQNTQKRLTSFGGMTCIQLKLEKPATLKQKNTYHPRNLRRILKMMHLGKCICFQPWLCLGCRSWFQRNLRCKPYHLFLTLRIMPAKRHVIGIFYLHNFLRVTLLRSDSWLAQGLWFLLQGWIKGRGRDAPQSRK